MGFFRKSRLPTTPVEIAETVMLDGRKVEVLWRRHPRARRLKLQIDTRSGRPVVSYPMTVPDAEAHAFLLRNARWALDALDKIPTRIAFAPGVTVPIAGHDHRIDHRPDARGGVRIDGDSLIVSGEAAHLPRRVTDFLKAEARRTVKPLASELAQQVGRKPGRISLRDQVSRWGSCAANGNLSFNWRLVLAPPPVLHYVVAHEVSHLIHMDHSPAFWSLVARLDPDYRDARDWLTAEGARLHRIG